MRWLLFVFTLLAGAGAVAHQAGSDEDSIRKGFADLQAAIKEKNADKIWMLLAPDTRSDADREARALKAAYARATDKSVLEKRFELTEKELMDVDGKLYVKSKAFFGGANGEMPDSKLDRIVIDGGRGKVFYTEADGDKEKRDVVRENDQWKFVLPIPRAKVK